MANTNFPIFLAEVDVAEFQAFRFQLPPQDIGRNDILIYVEYDRTEHGIVHYNAWGQFKDTYIRSFLVSSSISLSTGTKDVVSKIIFDLNSSDIFYEQVHSFIDHFGRSR